MIKSMVLQRFADQIKTIELNDELCDLNVELKADGSVARTLQPLTSHRIKITKILRGADVLKKGTVDLVVNGGVFTDYSGIRMKTSDDYEFKPMRIGTWEIFFCEKSPFKASPMKVDNEIRVTIKGAIGNYPYGLTGFGKTFSTKQDVYNWLKKYPNIIIPPEE